MVRRFLTEIYLKVRMKNWGYPLVIANTTMHSVFNIWSGEIFSYNSRIDYQNWPSDDIVESKVLISYYESLKATSMMCHQRQNTLFFGKKLVEVKISIKWGAITYFNLPLPWLLVITYRLSGEKVVDGNWPQGDTGESRIKISDWEKGKCIRDFIW